MLTESARKLSDFRNFDTRKLQYYMLLKMEVKIRNIYLVRTQNFPKNKHFLPHDSTSMCTYLGVTNVSFKENIVYLLNEIPLWKRKTWACFCNPEKKLSFTEQHSHFHKSVFRFWFQGEAEACRLFWRDVHMFLQKE